MGNETFYWDGLEAFCLCSLTKMKTGSVFPPSVTPLSTMHWSRAVMYPERGSITQMYHNRDTFDFSQGHVTKNQPMAVRV